MKNNKGIVLISTLMLVVLLSSILIQITNDVLLNQKRTYYRSLETSAFDSIVNLENIQINYLRKYTDMSFSKSFYNSLNKLQDTKINDINYFVEVKDKTNCLNINSLVTINSNDGFISYQPNNKNIRYLINYLEQENVEPIVINEFLDQAIDWIDKDDSPRPYGLEDYFYTGPASNINQYTGKRLFFNKNELLNLPATAFFDINALEHLCVIPLSTNFSLNINSLREDDYPLIRAIFSNFTDFDAKEFIAQIPSNAIKSDEDLMKLLRSDDINTFDGFIYKSIFFQIKTQIQYESNIFSVKSFVNNADNNSKILYRHYNEN